MTRSPDAISDGASGGGRGSEVAGAKSSAAVLLGGRVRKARQQKGLRLIDLAEQTGLSVSFISQMERGLTEPSMRSLIKLADALGTMAHTLMDQTERDGRPWHITRVAQTVTVPNDSGTARSVVERNPAVAVFDFVGGPAEYYTYYTLETDCVALVLAGSYEFDIEGEISVVNTGDAVYLRAGVEHRWRRHGRAKARLVSIHCELPTGTDSDWRIPGMS